MSHRFIITQGEHCVTADPAATVSTLLGSCVACCLWDPRTGIGGMNHILLANTSQQSAIQNLSGVNAMELLINDLLKLGAQREQLLAKVFGGAQMIAGLSKIGPANSAFVQSFLEQEGISCVSQSTGGNLARQVLFTPTTGAARVKTQKRHIPEQRTPVADQIGNGLELF